MAKISHKNDGAAWVDPRSVASVCVLGKGVTGDAVMSYFRALSDPPEIDIYTDDAEISQHYDLAVVSPGIPPHSKMVVSARQMASELISEPELAYRLSPERWIAITGTNGKTTTTALTAHVLNACGMAAQVAGNIGVPCIEAVCRRSEGEYIVAELSSYQLEYSGTLKPEAAVLLNITPDHLDWHGGFDKYRDAKTSLFERMTAGEAAIIDDTMTCTQDLVARRKTSGQRVIALGSPDGIFGEPTRPADGEERAYVDSGSGLLRCRIAGVDHELLSVDELLIKGVHNYENALAAAAVALSLGANPAKVAEALASFESLEHRIEFVCELDGVSFYNDSKATNPEATAKAITAFEGKMLVVMLGGKDKGTPLDELGRLLQTHTQAVVCFGEAGPRFHAALSSAMTSAQDPLNTGMTPDILQADGFDSAFSAARAYIQSNKHDEAVLLLSPACASYDEFDSYIERGRHFKRKVMELAKDGMANEI